MAFKSGGVQVFEAGVVVATRGKLDLISGSGVTLEAIDDVVNKRVAIFPSVKGAEVGDFAMSVQQLIDSPVYISTDPALSPVPGNILPPIRIPNGGTLVAQGRILEFRFWGESTNCLWQPIAYRVVPATGLKAATGYRTIASAAGPSGNTTLWQDSDGSPWNGWSSILIGGGIVPAAGEDIIVEVFTDKSTANNWSFRNRGYAVRFRSP